MVKRILLRRRAAFGDVLMATPVLTRLRTENPDAEIDIDTGYPALFQDNPYVTSVRPSGGYDQIVDLDGAHETRRAMHACDAYMEAAFGDRGEGHDKTVVFKFGSAPDLGCDWSKTITIHPNTSWRNRMFDSGWWQRVVDLLDMKGYSVVCLGTGMDQLPQKCVDTRGNLSPQEQAAAINASRAFLCGPSGLFILAGATEAKCVVPITISRPEHCLPWRHGELGWGFTTLVAPIECMGCNELAPSGSTFVGCRREDYKCIEMIGADWAAEETIKAAES